MRTYHTKNAPQKPVLLFSCEELLPLPPLDVIQQDLERATAETLHKVLVQCKQVTPVYDTLTCYLGEPWVTSSPRSTRMERKRNFTIKQKTIDDLVERETKLFEQETLRRYEGQEEIGLLEISKPCVDAHGYRIHQPVGEQAKVIDVHMIFSLAPVHIVRTLGEVYLDVFHRTDAIFRSYDHAPYTLAGHMKEGIVVHFGGLTTQLSLVHRGIPQMISSVPTGISTYERSLMESFAVTRSQIPSTCALVRDQNILNQARDVYTGRMIDAYTELHDALGRYVIEAKRYGHLVQGTIFLLGLPTWIEYLAPLIARDLTGTIVIPSRDIIEHDMIITHEAYHLPAALIVVLYHELHQRGLRS